MLIVFTTLSKNGRDLMPSKVDSAQLFCPLEEVLVHGHIMVIKSSLLDVGCVWSAQ
jgi:hypothetical protein